MNKMNSLKFNLDSFFNSKEKNNNSNTKNSNYED